MDKFTGKVWVLGDDIDTDIIIPTEYLALKTIDDMKQYGFSPLRPELAGQIQKGDIIVAGKNFGCGSSREQAPEIIKALGIQCVIAKSFARIFFRNSINNGLLLIEQPDLHDDIKEGDTITVKRMLEDGYMTIKVNTPCLITCIKELNAPRYMSVGGIFECYEKPYEVFDYNTLKDDPLIDSTTIGLKGSPTNIFKSFTPPQKGAGMMLEGADKDTCDKLAGILAAKHLI